MGKAKGSKKAQAKVSPKKAVKATKKPVKQASSSDEESSEEETTPVVKQVTNGKAKPVQMEVEADSSDESSEEEAKPAPKKATPAKKGKGKKQKAAPAKKETSSESDSDEEAPAPPKKAPAAKKGKAAAKAESSEEESSDDDEEMPAVKPVAEEESSDEEDSDDSTPAKKPVTAAKKGAAKEESSDEEDSDEEEDSDSEADVNGKRKAGESKKSAKKAKVEEEEGPVCLFIGNLPAELSEKKLKKFFEKAEIEVAEIRLNEKKPMAFVDLSEASDLSKALALNGTELKGNALRIERSTPKTQKGKPEGEGGDKDAGTTLFVKNVSYETTEDQLREFFPGATEIRMPTKPDGSIKGFAFLEFDSAEEVTAAIADKQGADLNGRAIFLDAGGNKPAVTTPGRQGARTSFGGVSEKTKILFVKNLSYDTTSESLESAFDGATTARVAMDRESGYSRGFGFVEFENENDAETAMNAMQGGEVDGREVKLDFATEGGGRGGATPRGGRGFGGRGASRGRGGGGGGDGCFKCGEAGHFSRECPQGGGGGGGDRSCYKCGEEGHISRDCPKGGGSGCFNCGENGHMSRECPTGGGGGGGFRGRGRGRGGDRGSRGGSRGGRGFTPRGRSGIQNFSGTKKSFDD